ncbi:toll/interleukin-1 receptor domain-containing protein [Leeuwenhoekiella sp. H156]|uniref:toll/interleukin-1 receptor domain-containing protein n=1 Tax=Leeuwenhoekiella sp. H156 TaxID=3450128 RepID=UPI003FA45E49
MEKITKIFISYSWDSESHKQWVIKLANYLIETGGCDVTLDQYDLSAGGNMTHFMERGVEEADKVLLIMTPNYKVKADQRQGGVGMEYSMISQSLYQMQNDNDKFLPVLRNGTLQSSAPVYIQTTIYHDMTNDLLFDKKAFELLRIIHKQPHLVKPKRGILPDFSNPSPNALETNFDDGFAASAAKILKAKQLEKELDNLYKSKAGVLLAVESATKIFEAIERKARAYSLKMGIILFTERFNNNNSLRVQAGDFYAIADYTGYTDDQVRLISIEFRSGEDKYYKPKSNQMSHFITLLNANGDDNKYFPYFNDDKTVGWKTGEIEYDEDDLVSSFFTMLLDEMSKKRK